ncbi:reverse transcriptase domain-containing protein [Oscillatoria sp. HE19RPO]|uniref:reverse transcriptase domain-containing protein n=1 Tax=Oscillatoria sp. HE19RPO TaxID=2954806 RepID=UPI0020C1C7E6|nr:reverse transcriptase domain-containing protein [Oscillatoria sp. HE19RPO]
MFDLVGQYLQRFVSDGGEYTDIEQGISLGCPLSPLMGALYLKPLDDRMAELGCFYVRYMDDWVILAPTCWKLRQAIKAVNQVMADLRVEKPPDKTFIGRIWRGFDFLGDWFSPSGLGVAQKIRGVVCRSWFPGFTSKVRRLGALGNIWGGSGSG